jgi:uncharacterized protein
MKIWIDADACPRDVKEVVFKASARLSIPVVLVANKAMHAPPAFPLVTMTQVKGGPDVADDHIVEHASPLDLAITADIPLAARLVEKKVHVIDPRGEVYDEDNVRERLSVRDFMAEARDIGITTGGPAAYAAKDKQRFAAALDRALHALRSR